MRTFTALAAAGCTGLLLAACAPSADEAPEPTAARRPLAWRASR